MIDFSLVDKWGRFEWVNEDKTIKRYPDRDDRTLCIHAERHPIGQNTGSGVCIKCAMKLDRNFNDILTQSLRKTIKELKEKNGYTDQQIIDELADQSFLGGQEELVMKLLREYNKDKEKEKNKY
jgi:hypothetical protein